MRNATRKVCRSEPDLSSCAVNGKRSPLTGFRNDDVSRVASEKSPYETAGFSPHIHCISPHLPHHFCRISYSLAHSNIALLLHAKLTPQVLPYLLTDTCSLKMIPSPAASIAACSGGVLGSIIKLKKRDRVRGMWGEDGGV